MTTTDVIVRDPWAGLNHKTIMSSNFEGVPRWVPEEERRRITAYDVLGAYLSNNARAYLPDLDDDPNREESWQEYGDVALLTRQIRNSVMGEEPAIGVTGADTPLAEGPDLPEFPPEPEPDLPEIEAAFAERVYSRQLELWQDRAEAAYTRWEADVEEQPALLARQDALREWALDERFLQKVVECEGRNVVPLGEGVYTAGWDDRHQRPTVEFFDPAAYFPVLDDDVRPSDFPTRVHLAWQYTEIDDRGRKTDMVRRITYELVPVDEAPPGWDAAGYLPEGEQQTHVCLMSDGAWPVEAFRDTTLDGLGRAAEWRRIVVDGEEIELRDYPLGYDFLPIVHVTHDLATASHFGESPIAALAQLFDEIQATDTDESLASRWAARPPFVVSGMAQASGRTDEERAANNTIDVSPGRAFKAAPGGGLDVLDMAKGLTAIGERLRALLKRLSVNGSISEGMIGRVDASEVPSGLALTLSFTSFEQMIYGARLARDGKYRLLLKMVQRIQIHHAGGWVTENVDGTEETSTEVYDAGIVFGAFMPQDLLGVVEVVTRALNAYALSIDTAVAMLQEAGVPVDDIKAEVAAIRARMGATAEAITAATGDVGAGAAWLGLREFEPVEAPGENGDQPAGTPVPVPPAAGEVEPE